MVHATSFHDIMSNSVSSESSDVTWLEWTYCRTRTTHTVFYCPTEHESHHWCIIHTPAPHVTFGIKKDMRHVTEKTYNTSLKWHACGGETICFRCRNLCLSIYNMKRQSLSSGHSSQCMYSILAAEETPLKLVCRIEGHNLVESPENTSECLGCSNVSVLTYIYKYT